MRPISIAVACLLILMTFAIPVLPRALGATPNLTVATQDLSGTALTGYWVQVTDTTGATIQSGFSPASFSLTAGNYVVSVGDYGGYTFSKWSDGTTTRSHPVTVTSTGTTSLTAIYCPPAGCGGSTISVTSQYSTGAAVTGLYVVLQQNGQTVATGFTPVSFSTTSGQAYTVTAYDYTSAYFTSWSTGATTRTISVTATTSTVSLTAIYCTTQGGCGTTTSGSSIMVGSQYQGGGALTGLYTLLQQGSTTVATGFTPVTFSTTSGQSYVLTVDDYTNAYFCQWSDGIATRTRSVTATSSQTALTAIFTTSASLCTVSGGGGGGTGTGSITVTGADLHTGAALTGFFVDIRVNGNHVTSGFMPVTFSSLSTGVQYQVVVYWYGSNYFRHFANGNLQRYQMVTLNSSGQSYTAQALYENVPKSQAASLNILAFFPNGTQIGTSELNNGYVQHSPGMYTTVTPPGGTAPFTATFTGGSILPFIFFNGQTYTVAMSAGYGTVSFDHWQDTGSTNPVRAITLNGNASYNAIYVQK